MEVIDKSHRLITTPHPVEVRGQTNKVVDYRQGESLYELLSRSVTDFEGKQWAVTIDGLEIKRHLWKMVYPKPNHVIEVRGDLGKQALYIVAMIALTYFTFGIGSAAGWGAGAAAGAFGGGVAGALFASAVFVAGSMIINKVLGPKASGIGSNTSADSVYSISGSRNQKRPYEPLPLLIGKRIKITPDIICDPYTWFQGNDQYVAFVLCPGLNCHRVWDLKIGDTPITNFEGVQVAYAGMPGMPEDKIPFYSNVDTIDGAELDHVNWATRTSSENTIKLMFNIEYILGGQGTSGKNYHVSETVQIQYRKVGDTNWQNLNRTLRNDDFEVKRMTLTADVEEGQYETRMKIAGTGNYSGKNTQKNDFQWQTLGSVQVDNADYTGIPRIAIQIKATGQLNSTPDTVNCMGESNPVPVWNGSDWVNEVTDNPGANILAYARGLKTPTGDIYAGIGLPDKLINIEEFKSNILHCTANNYTYNYIIRGSRSHEDMVQAMALTAMTEMSWAGGSFTPIWVSDGQPMTGVVNMATIVNTQFTVDYTLYNGADGIEYSYYDEDTWEVETVRVMAPGVTTMLNPTAITGEGITNEARAAEMARYHLAQSLYQNKDIRYTTDIEFLSYRRFSILQLQHDLTQWGYGGRLVSGTYDVAQGAKRNVVFKLDGIIKPPPLGVTAYIGIRMPGELPYQVFTVQPFDYEMDTVHLVEAWPSDVPFPGEGTDNYADDYLWVFDFKATPGYRVRVTDIQPGEDYDTGQVTVVPEPAQFWPYVKTGNYVPPNKESLLQTRPVASNVKVSEIQVVQGNTIFTELAVVFDISGDIGYTRIYSDMDGNGVLEEVANTMGRTARWRIPGAGTYPITVRPYSPDGLAGVAVSTIYTTQGADAPPVLVDTFTIEELSGGVRRYSWGFNDDTIQSADFAGVEIRYTAGSVTAPAWETMTPLGDTGYHAAAFEAVLPASGTWTFACRSRNTSGTLSTDARIVTQTLGANLGQQLGEVGEGVNAANQRISQEIIDRFNADAAAADALAAEAQARADALAAEAQARTDALAAEAQARAADMQAAAADATAKANAARDAAIAHADVIGAQVADITGADEWATGVTYPAGDLVKRNGTLYRALQETTDNPPESSPTYWEAIGNYSSLGEAVAASIDMGNTNASDIETESTRLDGVVARMPTGTGTLATSASVTQEATTRANADSALSSRTGVIEARLPTGTDTLANEARVVTAENASVSRDNALGTRVSTVEARMPSGSGELATSASVTDLQTSTANADSALSDRITAANSRIDGKADASALNSLSSTVTQQGNTITSQGNSITALQNSVANKADSSALNSLATRVTDAEGVNTSQGTALTQVQARIGVRPNLLPNPSFQNGMTGWKNVGVTFYTGSGINGTYAAWNGPATSGVIYIYTTVPVSPGNWYTLSADLLNYGDSGSMSYVDMLFYDSVGTQLADSPQNVFYGGVDFDETDTRRNFFAVEYLAPSNTSYVIARAVFLASASTVIAARRFKLERGRLPSTIYSEDAFGAAGAAATTALSATVTQQGNTITSQGNSITSLQNTVVNKADSSALNALSSTVTQQGNTITSQGNSITALQNSVANKADASALNALSNTVTQQGNTISSHSGQLTSLQNSVANKADSSALNALSSTVTQQGNTITSQGTAITSLQNAVGNKADASALSTLSTKVDNNYTAQANAITQVRARTNIRNNLLPNGGFEKGRWTQGEASVFAVGDGGWGRYMYHGNPGSINGGGHSVNSDSFDVFAGVSYTVGADMVLVASSGTVRMDIQYLNSSNQVVGSWSMLAKQAPFNFSDEPSRRDDFSFSSTAPAGAVAARVRFIWEGVTGCQALAVRKVKVESGSGPATAYSSEAMLALTATAQAASFTLALNVNGVVTGYQSLNYGNYSAFNVLAGYFNVVDPINSSNLLTYSEGNLTITGVMKSSLLQSSALELGSTRIHTGGGRLAPFTIKDSKYYVTPGSNTSKTLTLDGFVSPTSYSGYNHKRFAAYRSDVWLDAQIQGDTGVETAIIEVSYDGGAWQQIISVSFDCNYRGGFPIMVRYTTVDSWGTVSFRLRTTRDRTEAMRFTVDIANYNESGNAAGSNSGGSGGGSAPPPTGGGGEFCVDYETTVLPDGRFVRDLKVGDMVECFDVVTGEIAEYPLLEMGEGEEDCFIVLTPNGTVIQSRSTPMDMRDGTVCRTEDLAGKEVYAREAGWEVCQTHFIGRRRVCKPDLGNRMFFAGTMATRTIATHNIQYKPYP